MTATTKYRADIEYTTFNPFEGDRDVDIQCRKVRVVTTRKPHDCMAAYLIGDGHVIPIGDRAVKESAKVEGKFGSCYSCLKCLGTLIDERESYD